MIMFFTSRKISDLEFFFLAVTICIYFVDLNKLLNGNLEKTLSFLVFYLGGRLWSSALSRMLDLGFQYMSTIIYFGTAMTT